jgi:trimeric autotransporter adhesin
MTTRRLGVLGLMLGATLLGAACDDTSTPPPPPPAVTLNLLPDAATLNVGQTLAMTVVITNSTNQAASFVSSNPAVATVNATTGVVTAVAQGITVITATAAADANAKDASTITVNPPAAPPTVSIARITQGGLQTPVNPNNVSGQIDVVLNVNVPTAGSVQRVETLIDGTVVCSQAFSGTGSIDIDDEANAAEEIVCPIFTNTFNATTGAVAAINQNGPHTLSARLVQANGNIVATPSTPLIYNNQNLIVATQSTSVAAGATAGSNARSISGAGSLWNRGDYIVNLITVNFGPASGAVASATVAISTSGVGVSGVTGCRSGTATLNNATTDPTIAPADGGAGPQSTVGPGGTTLTPNPNFPYCGSVTVSGTDATASDGFRVTLLATNFPDDATPGVNGIEDLISRVSVQSVTSGGNAGPLCINPDPVLNPLATCATANPNNAVFPNPVRLDNLAPRVTLFDLTPTICQNNPTPNNTGVAPGPCYVGAAFAFVAGGTLLTAVDYGVDSQNSATTFSAGTSASALTAATSAASLAETLTANDLFLQAQVRDGLGNVRNVFPTTTAVVVTTSSTSGTLLKFGVDKTAPVICVTATGGCVGATSAPGNNGANDGNTYTIVAIDNSTPPAGPSGLGPNSIVIKVERITTGGTTCFDTAGATISCTTGGNEANGTSSIGNNVTWSTTGTQAYWRVTYFARDAAGNVSASTVLVTLIDTTAPTVGGIAGPSIVTGGASNVFTAAVSDNLDLGDAVPFVTYGALATVEFPSQTLGSYFGTLETSATATVTINPFIRSITPSGGAATRANLINFCVRDQAGVVDNMACPSANATVRTDDISTNVNADFALSGRGQTTFAFPFSGAVNNATVCNGDNAGGTQSPACPTNPTSTTFTGAVSGATATFNPNFSAVNAYAVDPVSGRAKLLGAATVTISDNGVTRTFTYTFTWTPTGLAAGTYNVFLLGTNTLGDGLQSVVVPVTVAID